VPYARYGETPEGVVAALAAMRSAVQNGLDRIGLQSAMRAGAARNALDCAYWDLEAKRAGRGVHELAGLAAPEPRVSAYTISLAAPAVMAEAAERAAGRPLLKVKLGAGDGDDPERILAVRRAALRAELIVDANEGWSEQDFAQNLFACADAGVTWIEQPLPEGRDAELVLPRMKRLITICADESVHDRASLDALAGKYNAVNIKLDKTGGLTEALALAAEAERRGFTLMVGCMVATSLAMAPALLLAQRARVVDLDGPLLLAKDREHGLRYDGSLVYPAEPALWG
jgi:L-alanine-DL-glutamate epimerase-like enolase superfamily enzyme